MAAPPAAAPTAEKVRPSGWWFLIAVVLGMAVAAGGIAAGVAWFISNVNSMVVVDVPGSAVVEIEGSGAHSLFVERHSPEDPSIPQFSDAVVVSLVSVDDGSEVPSRIPLGTMTYSMGDRAGSIYRTFEVPGPGTYELTVDHAGGAPPAAVAFDVEGVIGRGLFAPILLAVGAVFAGLMVTLVMVIVLIVRRSRSRRAAAPPPQAPPSGYAPPGSVPPGYAPPGYAPQGQPPGYQPSGYQPPPPQGGPPPAGPPG